LGNIGKYKEKFFPGFIHAKRPVGCITMLKKCLGEKRNIPMKDEKDNYCDHYRIFFYKLSSAI
jgi:hypothetical protein